MLNISYWVSEESVSLYWEKPEETDPQVCYQIFCDGAYVGETDKTHYRVSGLSAEKEYHFLIKAARKQPVYAVVLQAEAVAKTTGKRRRIDVTAAPYGARGDGVTMDTERLQRAIDDCGEGESIYFPKGRYLTGALRLHSDMELYLEEGAVLLGSDRPEAYLPRIPSRFEGIEMECYSSLLNLGYLDHRGGYSCRNVVIRGGGTIEGGGKLLAERVIFSEQERLKDYLLAHPESVKACEKPETIPGRVRPRLINMSNCQNVVLADVCLKNGASWNVHFIYSDQILTENCRFYSEDVWNGDGWDPDSSKNCTIYGCEFHTGDDAIAIKSGKNPQGNQINRPTEHVKIFDCLCVKGLGFAIGSEMSGGVRDVKIWDCDLSNSRYGIEIKGTAKRGGYVRDVHVRDCVLPRLLFHSVAYNDDGEGASVPPIFSDCSFERLHILGEYTDRNQKRQECSAVEFLGFDRPGHELSRVRLKDIVIGTEGRSNPKQIVLRACRDVSIEGITVL